MIQTYRRLLGILTPRERAIALLVCAFLVFVAAFEVAGVASVLPFMAVLSRPEMVRENPVLSYAYRRLAFESQDDFIFALGVAMFCVLVGSQLVRAAGFLAQIRFVAGRSHAFGERLLRVYLAQPYEFYLDQRAATLSTRVLAEAAQVAHSALYPAIQLVAQSLVVLFMSATLIVVDPFLALAAATVFGGAYMLLYLLSKNALNRIGAERATANALRYHLVQEAFGGIKEVKLAGIEEGVIDRFRPPSRVIGRSYAVARAYGELPAFFMQAIVFGGMLAILLFLIRTRGGLGNAIPTLTLYAFAGYRLLPSAQAVFSQLSELRYNAPIVETISRDLTELTVDAASAASSQERDGHALAFETALRLEHVYYQYPGAAAPAVRDLSIEFPFGARIGFVGLSGSGKTTVVNLILGLLTPTAGSMSVDARLIDSGRMRSWQRSIGYVPQHIFLTDESVAQNIAFGLHESEIDQIAVQAAAEAAGLHEFITTALPGGYKTPVGDLGVRLSGGQRQRIGIARALYRNPALLVLDEATSALDNVTEAHVMESIERLGPSKTVVIVAHRLSTVRSCDRIFVFDAGQVIASGSYGELESSSAQFRRLAGLDPL